MLSRMGPAGLLLAACLATLSTAAMAGPNTNSGAIRMNHLQMLHLHNSYHACPLPNVVKLYQSPAGSQLAAGLREFGGGVDAWSYSKLSIDEYLNQGYGVRSFEFDLYYDPTGGRYKYRVTPKLAQVLRASDNSSQAGGPDLDTPGWKVMHVPDFDFQSTCDSILTCLKPIADYSKANPGHIPFFIALEFKSFNLSAALSPAQAGLLNSLLNSTPEPPTSLSASPTPDPSQFKVLDANIRSLFDRSQLFSPDEFRGGAASNQDRIAKYGWPLLDDVRGKTFFRMLGSDDYVAAYTTAFPPGSDGLVFVEYSYGPGAARTPDLVFASADFSLLQSFPNISDPTATAAQKAAVEAYRTAVQGIVSTGKVMLRVTVDEPITEALVNFPGFAAAGIAGGAHFVHTDYPNGQVSTCGFNSTYTVPLIQARTGTWSGGSFQNVTQTGARLASTCNPVTALKSCVSWPGDVALPPAWCTCFSTM